MSGCTPPKENLTKQCVLCGKEFTMLVTKITKGKQKGELRLPNDIFYMDVPPLIIDGIKKQDGFEYWECPECAK